MRAFLKEGSVTKERANSLSFSRTCFLVGENLARTEILAYNMEQREGWEGEACCLLKAPDPLLVSKG